ncbi:MAG: tetratricopeptide repeat protein [Ardenticatenaceae bacterium]|nr:tetratricopeptide repeat protein [Ardenticatenaceae bacterium]MCB8947562.1 tetratricopeptide repeat protein [Ardenticatenaceae bacterium]
MTDSIQTGDFKDSKNIAVGDNAQVNVNEVHHHHPAPAEKPTFPIHQIAHPQNPNFTDREQILQQVEQTLAAGQTTVVTQTIAGLGGVGKTQLALAYSYAHLGSYDLIYWLSADSEPGLGEDLMALARRLKLIAPEATDQKAAVQAVLLWLGQTSQRWLLVYDNADQIEPAQLAPYLPRSGNGHVLITSRNPNYSGLGKVLELGLFDLDKAVAFLFQRKEAKGQKVERGSEAWQAAAALAEALGRLPLALEHAAAYVASKNSSYANYHQLFNKRQNELWQRAEKPERYHATITTTWELAFDEIKKTPGALDLLNLCCFLDPESIPLALIQQVAALETSDFLKKSDVLLAQIVSDELALDDALGVLRRFSLVQRACGSLNMQQTGNELTMHRLVQAVARNRMNNNTLHQDWLETTVALLHKTYRFNQNDMSTWPACGELLPHLIFATDLAEKNSLENNQTAFLNNETGFYLQHYGSLNEARSYYERALATYEKVLGPDHPDVALSLNNLGYLLRVIGDYERAQPYYERALKIREKALGLDHPDTAQSLNDQGLLLKTMGNYAEAQPYYERALAIREKVLGPDHPSTAQSLNNLGALLRTMGDYIGAKLYYKRALRIREKVLGPDHPDTARSVSGLGALLRAMGDHVEARPHYERALRIREKILGPDHLDTAQSLNNLGLLLKIMGNYAEARTYLERALHIREKALGLDHSDTAQSFSNLGILLQATGNYAEARPYLERALTIREKALGPDHPDTARSLNNLGGLLQAMGDLAEARPYYERALTIWENVLGPDHPDTARSLNNLAWMAHDEGDLAESAQLMQRALAIREKRLGTEHPDTINSRNSLAAIEAKISS